MSSAQIARAHRRDQAGRAQEARLRRAAERRQARLRDQAVRQAGQRKRRGDHQGQDRERADAADRRLDARRRSRITIVVIGYPGVADMKGLLDEKSQLEAIGHRRRDRRRSSTRRAASRSSRSPRRSRTATPAAPRSIMHGNVDRARDVRQRERGAGLQLPRRVVDAEGARQGREARSEAEQDTSRQWRAGLEHYWDDEYTAAIDSFREVETLFPAHSEARDLIRQSNQAKKEGKEKKPAAATAD